MLEKLLGMVDGRLFFPLVVLAGLTALAKALFGLRRSTSQDRRDFLDLWSRQSSDDLWLEVMVRHQFGAYLPASLIRRLQLGPQAARALVDVAASWDLLEMDDETWEVRWRAKRHRRPGLRKWERWACMVLYFVLALCGLMLGYRTVAAKAGDAAPWLMWLYVVLSLGAAFFCLMHHEVLGIAERSMSRWLAPRTKPHGAVFHMTAAGDSCETGESPAREGDASEASRKVKTKPSFRTE
jgi:hypothetical protein